MPGLLSDDHAGQLVDLLVKEFGISVDRMLIASYVAAAAQDLKGSICREALPEMACKLASHRLAELAVQRQDGDPARMPMATT